MNKNLRCNFRYYYEQKDLELLIHKEGAITLKNHTTTLPERGGNHNE